MLTGGAISWSARRQSVVAQPTAEAEYKLFSEYPTKFHLGIDTKAALALATNLTYNRKTRHIELHWHCVCKEAEKGAVNLVKVGGTENSADLLTKALPQRHVATFSAMIGMVAATKLGT
ncbi:Copia type Polyprotein [Phytophthora megakarya]|uniref:Copia type Polyprotein n=1 Tax=Phytophthora megakarya TaxID=4795 RepID=A0A225WHY2_9STRA|nr:Copia type Polyprotein [Phytophthora megakarya]